MNDRRWQLLLACTAIALGVLIQIPQLIYQLQPEARGVLVRLNSDEPHYLTRLGEALNGRPWQASEGIVGNPLIRGTQWALLEATIGTVFAPTGWRAATVLQILDTFTAAGVFLCLVWLFRLSGFSRRKAYAGALLFCLIELYGLNRPIHQGVSFILTIATLCMIAEGARGRIFWSVAGGALLGLLFGIYFWSWTFAWTWVGLFIVTLLWDWRRGVFATPVEAKKALRHVLLSVIVAAAITLPFVLALFDLQKDPLWNIAVFRSGIHPSRLPESWPYAACFALMVGGVCLTAMQDIRRLRPHRLALVTLLSAFVVMHQQVIHGQVFNFVSHYIFALAAAAMGVVLLAWTLRTKWTTLALIGALTYLGALAYDGRFVVTQFTVIGRFDEQHFASSLPVLDALPRSTVLSDPETSMFISGATRHDVVYSVYLKNMLMTHEDIARRFCAAVLPLPPNERHPERRMLIYPDANGAFPDQPELREQELELVADACAEADQHPEQTLWDFGVDYLFWDEKRAPLWNPERLRLPVERIAGDDGWSLWRLREPR